MTGARVVAVHRNARHHVSKQSEDSIELLAGLGVEGDAHAGVKVQHRSRAARYPDMENLRQVHLMHAELFDELAAKDFTVAPGQMGENLTTRGLDLLSLPKGTRLRIGANAVVELTGLRNPCKQLEAIQEGLMEAVLAQDESGGLIRKSGVMGVVLESGGVAAGDAVQVEHPRNGGRRLEPV